MESPRLLLMSATFPRWKPRRIGALFGETNSLPPITSGDPELDALLEEDPNSWLFESTVDDDNVAPRAPPLDTSSTVRGMMKLERVPPPQGVNGVLFRDVSNMMSTLSLSKQGPWTSHVALSASMMARGDSPLLFCVPLSTCKKLQEGKFDPNNASTLHKNKGAGFWTINGKTFLALSFSGKMHYSVSTESVWSRVSATVPRKTEKKDKTIQIWNPLIALCADPETKMALVNAVDTLNKCAFYNQSDRRIFIRDPGVNYKLKRGFKNVGKPPVYLVLWCSHDFTAVEALFYGQLQGHMVLPTCFNTQVQLPSGEKKGFNPIYTVSGAAAENILESFKERATIAKNMPLVLEMMIKCILQLPGNEPFQPADKPLAQKLMAIVQATLLDFRALGSLEHIWSELAGVANDEVMALENSPPRRKRKHEEMKREVILNQMQIAQSVLDTRRGELEVVKKQQMGTFMQSGLSAEGFKSMSKQFEETANELRRLEEEVKEKEESSQKQAEVMNALLADQEMNATKIRNLSELIKQQKITMAALSEKNKMHESEMSALTRSLQAAERESCALNRKASLRARNEACNTDSHKKKKTTTL